METSNPCVLNIAALPLPWNVQERLAGRVTDPGWLPHALHPDIDTARERHHELLRLAGAAVDEWQALRKRWKEEDAENAEALREAVRSGRRGPPAGRTSPEQRAAKEGRLAEKALAGAEVLAEHVDHVVGVVREVENDMLADLRKQAGGALEQRRQARSCVPLPAVPNGKWYGCRAGSCRPPTTAPAASVSSRHRPARRTRRTPSPA